MSSTACCAPARRRRRAARSSTWRPADAFRSTSCSTRCAMSSAAALEPTYVEPRQGGRARFAGGHPQGESAARIRADRVVRGRPRAHHRVVPRCRCNHARIETRWVVLTGAGSRVPRTSHESPRNPDRSSAAWVGTTPRARESPGNQSNSRAAVGCTHSRRSSSPSPGSGSRRFPNCDLQSDARRPGAMR